MTAAAAWTANGVLPDGTQVFHRWAHPGPVEVRFVDTAGQNTEYQLDQEGRSVRRFVDGVEVPLPAERATVLLEACMRPATDEELSALFPLDEGPIECWVL